MSLRTRARVAGSGAICALALSLGVARADMTVPSYQLVGPGTGPGSGPGTVYTPVSGSSTYSDSFRAPTSTISGTSYGFYDDFVFSTLAANTVDTLSTTISLESMSGGTNLGITGLQVRLFSLAGNTPLPVLSGPIAGTLIEGWSSAISYPGATVSTSWTLPANLDPGSYVLEVRGNVTGTSGGSYSGVLNLNPVPLPAGLPLLMSGLALLGGLRRRGAAAA